MAPEGDQASEAPVTRLDAHSSSVPPPMPRPGLLPRNTHFSDFCPSRQTETPFPPGVLGQTATSHIASRGPHPSSASPLQTALSPDPCAPLKDQGPPPPPPRQGPLHSEPSTPIPIRTSFPQGSGAGCPREVRPSRAHGPQHTARKVLPGPAFSTRGISQGTFQLSLYDILVSLLPSMSTNTPISLLQNTPTPPPMDHVT